MFQIAAIEDAAPEILLLRMALDAAGLEYELSIFSSGDSALQALPNGPAPDLIVTDGSLPGMGLEELLARLKQVDTLHSVPVIVVSGIADPRFIQQARASGAADYMIKPSNLDGWYRIGRKLTRIATTIRAESVDPGKGMTRSGSEDAPEAADV